MTWDRIRDLVRLCWLMGAVGGSWGGYLQAQESWWCLAAYAVAFGGALVGYQATAATIEKQFSNAEKT